MPNEQKFSDLVQVRIDYGDRPQVGQGGIAAMPRPHFVVVGEGENNMQANQLYATNLQTIQDLMRTVGASGDKAQHELMGAGVREPIRVMARYKAWTNTFFSDWPLDPADDNRIPVDQPIGAAFISTPEGRAFRVTPGVQQFVRPSFFEIKAGLEIFWGTLKTAGWPILRRRMEETSDEMARRFDVKFKALLDAAVSSSGQNVNSSSTLLKTAVDTVIKNSTAIGFPVTQGAINPARLMDQTGWTNGSSTAFPFYWAPETVRGEVFRQLYASGYGNIRWTLSYNIPMSVVYLGGEPEEIGYHQHHGQAVSASDVDIDLGKDRHMIRQEDAGYVGNIYNLWTVTIT